MKLFLTHQLPPHCRPGIRSPQHHRKTTNINKNCTARCSDTNTNTALELERNFSRAHTLMCFSKQRVPQQVVHGWCLSQQRGALPWMCSLHSQEELLLCSWDWILREVGRQWPLPTTQVDLGWPAFIHWGSTSPWDWASLTKDLVSSDSGIIESSSEHGTEMQPRAAILRNWVFSISLRAY